jgi:hypothetical protein
MKPRLWADGLKTLNRWQNLQSQIQTQIIDPGLQTGIQLNNSRNSIRTPLQYQADQPG